jgi:hypothetical protein
VPVACEATRGAEQATEIVEVLVEIAGLAGHRGCTSLVAMSEFAHANGFDISTGGTDTKGPAPRAADESLVERLEKDLATIDALLAEIGDAKAKNDTARWNDARARVQRVIDAAMKASAQVPKGATPANVLRQAELARALNDRAAQARAPQTAPRGYTEVTGEESINTLLSQPAKNGAQNGFAEKEANLRTQIDAMSPEEKRVFLRRLQQANPSDPVAQAFATRMTAERRARVLEYLKDAPRRDAIRAAQTPSSTVVDLEGEKKRTKTQVADWEVKGKEISNDDEETAKKKAKRTGAGVSEADLSLVPQNDRSWTDESGAYYDSRYGSGSTPEAERVAPKGKVDAKGASVPLYKNTGAVGVREKIGIKGTASTTGDLGTLSASGDVNANAEAGASGGYQVGATQAEINGAASAKAVVNANGEARADTKVTSIAGAPVDLGVGVKGDVTAGAEVGLGGRAGVGTDFTGIDLNIGGMAGIEGSAEVNATVGPATGRITGTAIAGAAAGADAKIYYEKGKIRIKAGAKVAWGGGAGLAADVEIDLKKAVEMGIITAQYAKDLADHDDDGVITINDPAAMAADGMIGAGKALDRGSESLVSTLDGDRDGKASLGDITVRANQAVDWASDTKDSVVDGVYRTKDAVVDKAIETKDAIVDGATRTKDAIADTADYNKDGSIDTSDATAAVGDVAVATIDRGKKIVANVEEDLRSLAEAVDNVKQAAIDRTVEAGDFDDDGELGVGDAVAIVEKGIETIENTTQAAYDTAASAGKKVFETADVDGDKKLGVNDAVQAGKNVATGTVDLAKRGVDGVVNAADTMKKKVVGGAKRVIDAGVETLDNTKKRAIRLGQDVKRTLDRDGDGSVGLGDAKAGFDQGRAAAKRFADRQKARVRRTAYRVGDRNRDGKLDSADIAAGARQLRARGGQMRDVVVEQVRTVYTNVTTRITQASETISSGVQQGYAYASNAAGRFWNYVTGR